jgi:hypothetical protein
VDLGFLRFVSAVGTQGAISKETKKEYFVRSYKVDVSSNGEDWVTIKEGSKQMVRLMVTRYKLSLFISAVVTKSFKVTCRELKEQPKQKREHSGQEKCPRRV